MTAQGGDILAYLGHAIAQAEQDANRWHDVECDVHAIGLSDIATLRMAAEVPGAVCDCPGPASVLRRCAADRKLIELHRPIACEGFGCDCGSCCATCRWTNADQSGDPARWGETEQCVYPCPTIQALAEGYDWTEDKR